MTGQPTDDPVAAQLRATVGAIRTALGDNADAVYLYGSAVSRGLKPASDLDLFVVLARPTTPDERRSLVDQLTPLSAKRKRPVGWRPLEVTAAVQSTLQPLAEPPMTDFQYGEWLRDRMDAGVTEPEHAHNPDLALLVAMVRQEGRPLVGGASQELIAEVPPGRLRRALQDVIPGLLEDLESDTANVLLTLARVTYTLATGTFTSKDDAADWAVSRLAAEARPALERARAVYMGAEADKWDGMESAVRRTAAGLQALIHRQDA